MKRLLPWGAGAVIVGIGWFIVQPVLSPAESTRRIVALEQRVAELEKGETISAQSQLHQDSLLTAIAAKQGVTITLACLHATPGDRQILQAMAHLNCHDYIDGSP